MINIFTYVIISKKDTQKFEQLQQDYPNLFSNFYKDIKLNNCYCFDICKVITNCFGNRYVEFLPELITYDINFIVIDGKTYKLICSNLTYFNMSFFN